MVTDPIADMLTRIRNAQAVGHQTVNIPFSKLKLNLAKILEKQEFVEEVTSQGRKVKKVIAIKLKYQEGVPAISDLKRISKPGQRIYLSKAQIRPVKRGYGIAILSNSQGLMTDKEAKKKGLGGEILCQIW